MKVKIEKLDHFGRGITYINGKICFVEKALAGEVVKIKVVKETKKYLLAKVVDYYRLSDDRVDEVCQYSDVCGGCNFLHLSLALENEFKCNKVKEVLKKFGGVSSDLIKDTTCVNEYNYRNKVTLHGKNNVIGFYEKGSNKIVRVQNCLLADYKINEMIEKLNFFVSDNEVREAVIKVSNDGEKVMIDLKGDISDCSVFERLVDTLIINDKVLFGDGSIISNIGSKKYFVSARSFFQVNKELTKYLYDEVLEVVKKVKPKKVLDLYCGTGTIGIYISDLVDEVIGVDSSESGIEDAKRNCKLNNCTNGKFICEKVENVIENFDDIDMIIVDPPRAGLDFKTIKNIKRISSKYFVYISCDPVTLARDLKELSTDYEVLEVKPYNMFPRTYHVECVSVLHRKDPEK